MRKLIACCVLSLLALGLAGCSHHYDGYGYNNGYAYGFTNYHHYDHSHHDGHHGGHPHCRNVDQHHGHYSARSHGGHGHVRHDGPRHENHHR